MSRSSKLSGRVLGDAAVHTAVRLVSGLLSLYLFALMARLYPSSELKGLYFFLMIFGFAASALRTLANVLAGLQARHSRPTKLRRFKSCLGEVMIASAVVVPFTLWLLADYTHSVLLLTAAAIVLAGAAIDTDPLRALLDRPPRFAQAFALGSALAVGWVLLMSRRGAEHAIVAILLQWLPVASLNFLIFSRIALDCISHTMSRLRRHTTSTAALFFVATFDGIVLNLPFLLGSHIPESVGIDAAVVIRIFSASLIMFPLVLHWSNSSTLASLARTARMTTAQAYFLLQSLSAIACGVTFGFAYAFISRQLLGWKGLLMFVSLVAAFCFYSTAARFRGRAASSGRLSITFFAIALAAVSGGLYVSSQAQVAALAFTALQCAALAAGGFAISYVSRTRAGSSINANR